MSLESLTQAQCPIHWHFAKKYELVLLFPNYRTISNLAFLSKAMERSVCFQIVDHFKFQSAYTEGHSCETALQRIQNNFHVAMDNQEVIFFILLDMSSSFDTVSHDLHLERLSVQCSIKGKGFDWISSYLRGRRQAVSYYIHFKMFE